MAIRRDTTLNFKTSDGKSFPVQYSVHDGKSDFELWLEQPGNAEKTLEDYNEFKKGAHGALITEVEVTEVEVDESAGK